MFLKDGVFRWQNTSIFKEERNNFDCFVMAQFQNFLINKNISRLLGTYIPITYCIQKEALREEKQWKTQRPKTMNPQILITVNQKVHN